MAQINTPIQPTNDPNYEQRSRPVDIPDTIKPRGVEENRILPKGQEIADRSAEYLGQAAAYGLQGQAVAEKGYGDLFAGIVGIGDFMAKAGVHMVKKDIEDQVYEVANKERLAFTAELEKIKAGGGKGILDANAEMGEETPQEISDLPDTLGTLQSARNAGKLSKTDYQGRLLEAAKDLRNRYPGFKQEIDHEFTKVTGVNPANAVITGLINDINRANSNQNSERNRQLSFIRSRSGYQGAEDAYRKVESGEWGGTDVVKWAAPQERARLELTDRAAVFNDRKLSTEDRKQRGKELFDTGIAAVVQTNVENFMSRIGISSQADAEAIAAKTQNGEITSKRWAEIGDEWQNKQLQLRQAILRDAREKGVTAAIGIDEVNARTDAAMKQMDEIGKRIFNRDSGGIYKTAQWIKAQGDEDQKRLLQDSVVGADFRSIETIRRIGGEQFLQSENLRKLTNGLSGRFSNYQDRWIKAIQSQTDMATDGVPITLNRAFDEFRTKMKDATDSEKRKMNASMIDEITRIADPNVPDSIKVNYALTAFHPNNRDFISKLNIDSKDERGNVIQGQNAVFQKFTSPEITKEMYRLGQTHPGLWKNYVDWTQETLGNELISRELRYLGEIRNPAIRVGWDSDNKRFTDPTYNVTPENAKRWGLKGPYPDAEFHVVQGAISRINANLSNFKHVAEVGGGSVEAFILGTIAQTVGPQALSQVDNIPADVARQIGLTQLKKRMQ